MVFLQWELQLVVAGGGLTGIMINDGVLGLNFLDAYQAFVAF